MKYIPAYDARYQGCPVTIRPVFVFLLVVSILALTLSTACKKDNTTDDNNNNTDTTVVENSIKAVLNGGSFSNSFVTFNNFIETQTFAGWFPGNQISRIDALAQWSAETAEFKLYFPDTIPASYAYSEPQPPNYALPEDLYFLLNVKNTPLGDIAVKQVNFSVTEYGPVGGRIKGTFSGQFYAYNSNGDEYIVTVTNGQFDIERNN